MIKNNSLLIFAEIIIKKLNYSTVQQILYNTDYKQYTKTIIIFDKTLTVSEI